MEELRDQFLTLIQKYNSYIDMMRKSVGDAKELYVLWPEPWNFTEKQISGIVWIAWMVRQHRMGGANDGERKEGSDDQQN